MPNRPHSNLVEKGTLLSKEWRVIRKIGEGGFGAVYKVKNLNKKTTAALKLESISRIRQKLKKEATILQALQDFDSIHSCPFFNAGITDTFSYIIMGLAGKNLRDLRKSQKTQAFSLPTTIKLFLQCLDAIEDLHVIGYLHRDIKPSNFAMGRRRKDHKIVYMLDYGLARSYLNGEGSIRNPRHTAGFRGTLRYASLSTHKKYEFSPNDDLISLFYMIVEMRVVRLPWMGISDKEEVEKHKEKINAHELILNCPYEFHLIYDYLTQQCYADIPDYELIRRILEKVMLRYHIEENTPFDWQLEQLSPISRLIKGIAKKL